MIKTIKLGYIGNEVIDLCNYLKITETNEFNKEIESEVIQFQKNNNLTPDGIVGPKTWLALYGNTRIKDSHISKEDYIWAGKFLGCSAESLMAVVEVETGGKGGFVSDGKPQILFEGHVFWKELKERGIDPEPLSKQYPGIVYKTWTKSHYIGGPGEYKRYEIAERINEDAAICSTSWGIFQILGENYKLCSCNSPKDFYNKMCFSQVWQFLLGIEFIRSSGLYKHLITLDWAKFAKGYNGPGYAQNEYDKKLERSYLKFRAG